MNIIDFIIKVILKKKMMKMEKILQIKILMEKKKNGF